MHHHPAIFGNLICTYCWVPGESGAAVNCVSCHNTREIDTLNWNPSALEIAIRTSGLESLGFANLILNPLTAKQSEVHDGIILTGKEINLIRVYFGDLIHIGHEKPKPVITGILVFYAL